MYERSHTHYQSRIFERFGGNNLEIIYYTKICIMLYDLSKIFVTLYQRTSHTMRKLKNSFTNIGVTDDLKNHEIGLSYFNADCMLILTVEKAMLQMHRY